jgi:glutathione synthase/RimK-type ligase-like ATP-grasp enzyme
MILVVTNKRDITSDFVILELQRRGLQYMRLNTEDLALGEFQWSPSDGGEWNLQFEDISIEKTQIKAAYYRRPGALKAAKELGAIAQDYSVGEWQAALNAIYWSLDGRWLNAPHVIALAENKIRQLTLARELGFRIPHTLVSNAPKSIASFANRGESVIGKPLRNALIHDGETERVIFTSRIQIDPDVDPLSLKACPIIFQNEVPKLFDVRTTVVGDQTFTVTIDSQSHSETVVDWRRTSKTDLAHAMHALPEELSRLCVELTRKLGLRFSAIDFILDEVGQYWFLEANPNGQWAWIEARTGHPIACALASELEKIADEVS